MTPDKTIVQKEIEGFKKDIVSCIGLVGIRGINGIIDMFVRLASQWL